MPNPSMRASDRDRDRTADLLREHHAQGRLDPEEFAERLDKSFTAKTVDELDALTADLPAIDTYPLPAASLPRNRVVRSDLPASYIFGDSATGVRIWRGSGRVSPGWLGVVVGDHPDMPHRLGAVRQPVSAAGRRRGRRDHGCPGGGWSARARP